MVSQPPNAPHRRLPPSRPSPGQPGPSTRNPNPPRGAPQSRPPLPGVRFVDVRLAVPVDSPIHSRIQSPTERRPSLASVSSSGSVSPMLGQRPKSPYGFIPIRRDDRTSQLAHPPFSPLDFRKGVHSPSMMSYISDDTDETASMTLDTSSRMGSPSPYGSPTFSRGSPRPKTPTGRGSPFAKTEDDPLRKNRIKTEMCMHYVNNRPCPFGASCTYAHGEEELQMTKLLDLGKAGLVDLETFRTKPCLTWVMTGSCPFGSRCTCIHDPRATGTSPSWLTHTETQGNTIATDINVESMHQKRFNEVHSDNPFGHQFSLLHDTFSELYKLICNLNFARGGWVDSSRRHTQLVDMRVKLQIALKMRGGADWCYKFRPQNVIHDEMCMVLQHRGFHVEGDHVVEIPLSKCQPRVNPRHVDVRELAFGPDSDTSVRGVALWFNIDDSRVVECTPAQAKRYRFKRGKSKKDQEEVAVPSVFDQLDCFEMIRPNDAAAFDLARDILRHRLAFLRTESIGAMRERYDELGEREKEKERLKRRFEALRSHWILWAWPINEGRAKVDKYTYVPKVDGTYSFPRAPSDPYETLDDIEDDDRKFGRNSRNVWLSFVNYKFDVESSPSSSGFTTNRSGRRLPVFQHLASGQHVSSDRSPPLICDIAQFEALRSNVECSDRERCWRSLLLKFEPSITMNEWELVRDHFENSRSNKVLNIIQSKSSTSTPPGFG